MVLSRPIFGFYSLIVVSLIVVPLAILLNMAFRSQAILPVVVVGSGLGGLVTTFQLTSNNIPVLLLEKASTIGGNSIKASSGISGAWTSTQRSLDINDSAELFLEDTLKSANKRGSPDLMRKLTEESASAIEWLQKEFGLGLNALSQLGGHSAIRTHRSKGPIPIGYELITTFSKRLETFTGKLHIRLNSTLVDISVHPVSKQVQSVTYINQNGERKVVLTKNVVVCTGGFGYSKALLERYVPAFVNIPTTNGPQITGDGQLILERLGAKMIDMDQVQLHPTGFIDPANPESQSKFLAAEALRANGGILLHPKDGRRFVNELATRLQVTKSVQVITQEYGYVYLVMSGLMYKSLQDHMDFYLSANLVKSMTIEDLARDQLNIPTEVLIDELRTYSISEEDIFNRTHRVNAFGLTAEPTTIVYVGKVVPVVHFTMGGATINTKAQVLAEDGSALAEGLYAVGEVAGGTHGQNRLGGSSLLECIVFGKQAALSILEKCH